MCSKVQHIRWNHKCEDSCRGLKSGYKSGANCNIKHFSTDCLKCSLAGHSVANTQLTCTSSLFYSLSVGFTLELTFKFLLFCFKALNGLQPFLVGLVYFREYERTWRSTNTSLPFVTKSIYKRWGGGWTFSSLTWAFLKLTLKPFYSGRLLIPTDTGIFVFFLLSI